MRPNLLGENYFHVGMLTELRMKPTGVVYHPIYLQHDTGSHPERKERLTAILDKIRSERLLVEFRTPKQATVDQVAAVHERRYIDQVKSICEQGGGHLDWTPSSPGLPTMQP
jgi:acetoin utilization deacetylase AcuC-like enzyme